MVAKMTLVYPIGVPNWINWRIQFGVVSGDMRSSNDFLSKLFHGFLDEWSYLFQVAGTLQERVL